MIVDLDSQRPHWSGEGRCRSNPTHKWVAIVPVTANPFALECPHCKMPGIKSGYLHAAGLSAAEVQEQYEKIIRDLNGANAFLATALYQATDGEQGANYVGIEKTGDLQ